MVLIAVTPETQLDGKPMKKDQKVGSQLKKEFQEGDQVRTSFDVKNKSNVARSIDKSQQQSE